MLSRIIAALAMVCVLSLSVGKAQASCEYDVSSLVGYYDFTTLVTGAKDSRQLGTRGFYRASFQQDGCALKVGIVKFGYNNVRFKKDDLQMGVFNAEVYPVKGPGQQRLAVFVDATLEDEDGFKLPIGLTFVGEMGFYRYLGEAWDKYALWGPLKLVGIANAKSAFRAVEHPKCTGKALEESSRAVAGLFTCDEALLASPDLRRVLWFHPQPRRGEDLLSFEKVVASGVNKGLAFAVFCATGQDGERSALAMASDGTRSASKNVDANARFARMCQVKPGKVERPEDRWSGTIDGGDWDGFIGGGTTQSAGNPFDDHPFLAEFANNFCRGNTTESDLTALDKLAQRRTISARALVAVFNLYGAFYGYEFKSEQWLNDLYYGAGVNGLPASCRAKVRAYASASEIPMHFGKTRDRVQQIWKTIK